MKNAFRRPRTLALVGAAALGLAACSGSNGPAGADGTNGTDGAPGPHATFSNSSCIDCHHMSDQAIAMGVPLRPHENGGAPLVDGATKNNVASFKSASAGTEVTLSVVPSFTWEEESTGEIHTVNVAGVYWQYMDGLPSTITTGTVTSKTIGVTIPSGLNYKNQLAQLAITPNTSTDPNRYRVVPLNDTNLTLATVSRYLLTVFGDDGKVYWDLIGVKASDASLSAFAPVHTTGEPVVPINLPVLLAAKNGTLAGTWSITSVPTGSSAATTLKDADTAYPYFTPDFPGKYTITDGTGTINVYAGTWKGVITGPPGGELLPATYNATCTGCHQSPDDPLTAWSGQMAPAPNKFASWAKTGHAKRFTQGLNESGAAEPYGTSCFNCHTVGFVGTAKGNGGFHDQSGYDDFVTNVINTATAPDPDRYKNAWSNPAYTSLLQRTNIQCEQCHGPQDGTGAHPGDAGVSVAGTRESLDANVCGLCHGAATHHTRFQTWKMSPTGHANYKLARDHGTDASCAGCHSAQGYMVYQQQLVNGNPLRTIPTESIKWTDSTVEPQTCAVCHDPHNVGTESDDSYFTPEQVTNDGQPRFALLMAAKGLNPGDTPKLPAGFRATGVGKGNQCVVCHNSRNGADPSGAQATYLHEDNDPVFGALSSYAAPHVSAQADVLMGHNAYFVEDSGGDASKNRGPHSTLPDTCVTCHMEKTPPPYIWTENDHGTNHTFKADIGICTDCHGVDTGLGTKLRMDTQTQLDQVKAAIEGAVVAQAGSYNGKTIASAAFTAGYSPKVDLTYSDGTSDTGVAVGSLVSISSSAGQTLAKAIWNYNLITNDQSRGVHNPNFVRKVLGNSYEYLLELQ